MLNRLLYLFEARTERKSRRKAGIEAEAAVLVIGVKRG
jgi:hypothetical protein